ncbi:MAG: hypothetical protein AB1515_10740, partial [Nitrospirota bacterium]
MLLQAGMLAAPDVLPALDFAPPRNLSETAGLSWLGRVIAVDGQVYVAWFESGAEGSGLALRISTDGGDSFGSAQILPDTAFSRKTPGPLPFHMWATRARLYLIWSVQHEGAGSHIGVTSYERAAQAMRSRRLAEGIHAAGLPVILADDDRIYAAWLAESPRVRGRRSIALAWSQGDELAFEGPREVLTHAAADSSSLLMAAWQGRLWLCWVERAGNGEVLRMARSTDGGAHFDKPLALARTAGSVHPHKLIVEGARVFVAWLESSRSATEGRLRVAVSTNAGVSFKAPALLSNRALSTAAISGDGREAVYAAWSERDGENTRVAFSRSNDGGRTFSSPMTVFRGRTGPVQFTQLQRTPEWLVIIWKAEDAARGGKSGIFYSASPDKGKTFSP